MKTKIAIALHSGYKSLEAEPLTVEGFDFGIHKHTTKSGWTVTVIPNGHAFCHAETKAAAIQRTERIIAQHGVVKVREAIDSKPKAPPVDTLEAYVAPVREAGPVVDLDALVQAIADRVGGLDDEERKACKDAFSSRSGRLLNKAPNSYRESLANAAWNGLQPNPWKVQYSCVFHRGKAVDLMVKLSKFKWPVAFDSDAKALYDLGVW